jgi:hypothetical protein
MFLIAGPSVSPSNAGTLEGKKCSKIGQVKNSSGIKYLCRKNKNKLIWSGEKNNSILSQPNRVSNASGPKPGDLPPRNLENCGEGVYFYRMNSGVLERSFFEKGPYVSKDPRPNSSFDPIRVKAYETIRNRVSKSSSRPTQTFYTSKEFPSNVLTLLKNQLNESINYWSDYIPSNSEVHGTFTTPKNSEILF